MTRRFLRVPNYLKDLIQELKRSEYLLDLTPEGIKLNSVDDSPKTSLRVLFEDAIRRYDERRDEEEVIEDTSNIKEG